MKAREMFKKLGYTFIENNYCIAYGVDLSHHLLFVKSEKEIMLNFNGISVDELKAINKQAQELGWFDEQIPKSI